MDVRIDMVVRFGNEWLAGNSRPRKLRHLLIAIIEHRIVAYNPRRVTVTRYAGTISVEIPLRRFGKEVRLLLRPCVGGGGGAVRGCYRHLHTKRTEMRPHGPFVV